MCNNIFETKVMRTIFLIKYTKFTYQSMYPCLNQIFQPSAKGMPVQQTNEYL